MFGFADSMPGLYHCHAVFHLVSLLLDDESGLPYLQCGHLLRSVGLGNECVAHRITTNSRNIHTVQLRASTLFLQFITMTK